VTEHVYATRLRTALLQTGIVYQWKINDLYTNGVPDRFIEGPNRDLWLEAKHIKEFPKRDSTLIDLCNANIYLSKLQQEWLLRRYNRRRDSAVLVSSNLGATIFTDLSWTTPITAQEMKQRMLPMHQVIASILSLV
jgi:hypothetical protein